MFSPSGAVKILEIVRNFERKANIECSHQQIIKYKIIVYRFSFLCYVASPVARRSLFREVVKSLTL